jgi:hypothetical protein
VTPCESSLPCEVTLIHAEILLSVDFVFQIKRVMTADLNGVNAVFLNETVMVRVSCSRCELGGSDSDEKDNFEVWN